MTRARLAVALLLPALGLAACTSGSASDAPSAPGTSEVTTAPTTPPPPPSTTSTSSAAATSTSPAATASSTSAAPTSTAASAPAFTTTCASLSVRVFKGGGIRGTEIAAMQFVNDGTTPCTITGTPSVRLVRKGAVVGSPSRPDGTRVRPFTVEPGDYAESLLRVNSTCNAPLSDTVRYRLPARGGAGGRTVREPIELRACTMTVAPASAPA